IVLYVEVVGAERLVCSDAILLHRFSKLYAYRCDESSMLVDGWNFVAGFVLYSQWWNAILFCYTEVVGAECWRRVHDPCTVFGGDEVACHHNKRFVTTEDGTGIVDRKSTRLNSSHVKISYAVFSLK